MKTRADAAARNTAARKQQWDANEAATLQMLCGKTIQRHVLPRNDQPDLSFEGTLLTTIESDQKARGADRWSEIRLYLTTNGRLVAQEIGHTRVAGEHQRSTVFVRTSEWAISKALGFGPLAKDLYRAMGWTFADTVENES